MKWFVIVDDVGIFTYDKWSQVEKNHDLKKSDFVKHGDEHIVRFDADAYNISKDIKVLETVATSKVFGQPKIDWLTAFATACTTVIAILIFL